LLIIGCGGLGMEVLWSCLRMNGASGALPIEVVGFTSEFPSDGLIEGVPFVGTLDALPSILESYEPTHFIVAIGNNEARQRVHQNMVKFGLAPFSVVDPSVTVGFGVVIGCGVFVGVGSILSPNAVLGDGVLVNQSCTIGHDSKLDDFSQVCPGGRVSGKAVLSVGSFMGSNSVTAPGVTLGDWAVLGALSMANRDLPAKVTAIGNPARVVFRKL